MVVLVVVLAVITVGKGIWLKVYICYPNLCDIFRRGRESKSVYKVSRKVLYSSDSTSPLLSRLTLAHIRTCTESSHSSFSRSVSLLFFCLHHYCTFLHALLAEARLYGGENNFFFFRAVHCKQLHVAYCVAVVLVE